MIGRIRHRHEFDELARGRRVQTTSLWCRHLDDPAIVPIRVAFAIGRDVGHAVARNRLRRRLRSILGELAAAGGPLGAGWLLVGARPAAGERTFAELRHDVTQLLDLLAGVRSPPIGGGPR